VKILINNHKRRENVLLKDKALFIFVIYFLIFYGASQVMAQGKGEYKGKRVMVIYWQRGNDTPPRENQAVDAACAAIKEQFGRNHFIVVKEPLVSQDKASEDYFLNLAQAEDADILVLFDLVAWVDENTAFGIPKAYVNVMAAAYDVRRKAFFCRSEEEETERAISSVLALREAGEEAGWDAGSNLVSRIKRKFVFIKKAEELPPLPTADTPK
jgi:hypothetical protein